MSEVCEGIVIGVGAMAVSKRTPLAANRSRVGVRASFEP